MKKAFPLIIAFVVVAIIVGSLIYVFEERLPFDDTKKLYISCGGKHEKLAAVVESNQIIFDGKENCEMNIDIRDIQRENIKLKSNKYVYYTDAEGNIEDSASYYDIIVDAGSTLVVYGPDKTTKFTFQFK